MFSDTDIDSDDVKRAAFDYLDNHQDYSTVTNKQLRTFIEDKLKLPKGYLKANHKNILIQAVSEYRSLVSLRDTNKNRSNDTDNENSDEFDEAARSDSDDYRHRKKGKFTRYESELIRRKLEQFASEHGMSGLDEVGTELVTVLRDPEEDERKAVHSNIWKEIHSLLPHRKLSAIYNRGRRMLARRIGDGAFSPAQQQQLLDLVNLYGHDFTKIGRLMQKLPDDCIQQLIRLKGRKIEGAFTRREDVAMIKAVRELTGKGPNEPLPRDNIPWTSLSLHLNCERLPLDYNRRWPLLLLKVQRAGGEKAFLERCRTAVPGVEGLVLHSVTPGDEADGEVCDRSVLKVKPVKRDALSVQRRELELLNLMHQRGYLDETEVLWREVDAVLEVQPGSSRVRWRQLNDSHCPRDDASIYTFEERLEYLLHFCRTRIHDLERSVSAVPNSGSTDQTASASNGGKKRRRAVHNHLEYSHTENTNDGEHHSELARNFTRGILKDHHTSSTEDNCGGNTRRVSFNLAHSDAGELPCQQVTSTSSLPSPNTDRKKEKTKHSKETKKHKKGKKKKHKKDKKGRPEARNHIIDSNESVSLIMANIEQLKHNIAELQRTG